MSDQNIFGENQSSSATQPNSQTPNSNGGNVQPNQLETLLASIKNERGEQKYKTLDDALVALQHSQTFIPSLKAENEAVKAEAERLRKEAERITELENLVKTLAQNQPTNGNTNPQVVDEEKIATIVQNTLTRVSQDNVRKENVSTVISTLQQKFGTEAEKVFYGKAEELGFSKADINELAAKSPKAVFNLFGISTDGVSKPNAAPNNTSVNTAGFQPNSSSFISANSKPTLVGASTQELMEENLNARKLVDELHASGKSISDLTDPKVYFKTFRK